MEYNIYQVGNNSTEMNSNELNSTELNSSVMNSTQVNSNEMNSNLMNSTLVNSRELNTIENFIFDQVIEIRILLSDTHYGSIHFHTTNNSNNLTIIGDIMIFNNIIMILTSSSDIGLIIVRNEETNEYNVSKISIDQLNNIFKSIERGNVCYLELNTNQIKNPSIINECGICMEEKLEGISPECCNYKQEICLKCLANDIKVQSETKNIFEESIDETENCQIKLAQHYRCPFCRNYNLYYKYLNLLKKYFLDPK